MKSTAYTTLNDANNQIILDAIKNELKEGVQEDQKIMPPGTMMDYDQLVLGVIRKVFGENLRLFKGPEDTAEDTPGKTKKVREDSPIVDELMKKQE
ncbi:hypothetical protein PG994_008080 [Apiospora phragmitis]|uniref:Uncharacterized protein n=1 Tax=Apiospora phragmitis TaxID=2905665 RepID=A0ABR1UV46_9PEZI